MKIIIVGCGKVGITLAERLNAEGHDITLIDKDGATLRTVADRIDVMGLEGNGVSYQVQLEAGVKQADLLIATTHSDEQNMLCCLIARKAGNCHTIARIRDPEYIRELHFIQEELNMSMVINPELEAAREVSRLIKYPSAIKIDSFAKGRVDLMKLVIPEGSELDGLRVYEVNTRLKCRVLICIVERGGLARIPDGSFELQAGDHLSFVGDHKQSVDFFKKAHVQNNAIRSILLIGGGKMTYYVAKALEETGTSVKIIERDFGVCQKLSELLPKAMIINGDGTDQQLLLDEGIEQCDSIATFTGIDEENIMLSLYAGSLNPKAKMITKINRIGFDNVIHTMNLGSVINPKLISADRIVSYVRAMQNTLGSNVETLYRIAEGAEALEFKVGAGSPVADIELQNLTLKPGLLVACINRGGKILIPGGQDTIKAGDTVIIVTTQTGLNDLKDILKS
ncbi:MAG: Trk system potassium transporter TrkA [Lachnospiraceae bacterium]|nr:Trk system potassium transporter TrkA [Lachnospiraceae bacterium]